MTQTARNVLIVLALATVVWLVPGGGNASAGLLQALVTVMLAAVAWWAARLYRERRIELHSLGERNRAILYGSVGLAALTVTGTSRLWGSGGGTIAWIALMGLAVYGVWFVFHSARQH